MNDTITRPSRAAARWARIVDRRQRDAQADAEYRNGLESDAGKWIVEQFGAPDPDGEIEAAFDRMSRGERP